MNTDDLLALLDAPLAPTGGAGAGIAEIGTGKPATAGGPVELSATALLVDEWTARRGRELLGASERFAATGADEHAAADFFCAAFDPNPEPADAPADPRRAQFLANLLESPECQALRAATVHDGDASEIAATAFAEQFAELRKRDEKRDEGRKGKPKTGAAADRDRTAAEVDAVRAAMRAVDEATKEVEEREGVKHAFGMGPGAPGGTMDPNSVTELFKRVRGDHRLRRICELAGRFRMVARSKQRVKAAHGYDDMVGVEPAGDVGRLLPTELASMADPDLELDTLRRLVERQTLCREYRGTEAVAKGPIIVVVDESGSMGGEKVSAAKALALALAWVAAKQNRWVGLIAYSGDGGHGRAAHRLLPLPPHKWDTGALADWLARFIGGGSSTDVPVREMADLYREVGAPDGKTDLLFVTDALCSLPPHHVQNFNRWKKEKTARLITLLVGGADPAGSGLDLISDECHAVPALTADSEAVGRVLSV